ncbi:hypothetical protein E4U57_005476 [Claviceps arundinis]|uniref:Uncharacterized protein n=1 Tax=Claviceps arundinis TaxID=1623583 RepID=A0ABQ7P3B6_9HYPO|nr:hypothetical protein E4U57_005476 [Claviceps arundinis]
MKLLLALFAISLALAAPAPDELMCQEKCFSGMNECGVYYESCFNPCREPPPQVPLCKIITKEAKLPPREVPTPSPTDDCSTRIICVDAINECGIMYGGCFPDCGPWNLEKPPCPTATMSELPQQTPF